MNIMNLFRPGAPVSDPNANANNQQPAPGTLPTGATSTLETGAHPGSVNNNAPGSGVPPNTVQKEASPLDPYAKLYDTVNIPGQTGVPQLNADAAKIGEVAKTLDFAKTIDPALAQKALAGDVQAFIQVIDAAAKQSFIAATQATSHLVDRQTSATVQHMQKNLPGELKRFQSAETLLAGNPQLSHPAAQPLLSVIQTQLANQFPQATAAELATHAQSYLAGLLNAVQKPAPVESNEGMSSLDIQRKQATNFDWTAWSDNVQQQRT